MTCRYQRTIKIKILDNFEKIESVLPQIHGDRKRMVNINFILKQIFKIKDKITIQKYINIQIKKNIYLAFYKKCWCRIQTPIGDDIKKLFGDEFLWILFVPFINERTHIDNDINNNPYLSQIILIIVWFASHKGIQINQYFFMWCVSETTWLDFFLIISYYTSNTPAPGIVPNTIGFIVTSPAIIPQATRDAYDKLHAKFNILYALLYSPNFFTIKSV